MENSYLLHTVPVLVSHFSGCGAFVSDLNESLEYRLIVEHNYRVRDGHMTNRSIRWKKFARVFWKEAFLGFFEESF